MDNLKGASEEISFWKGFIKTDRFLKGWVLNEKTPELRQEVHDFIKSHLPCSVLDVGSGVVSILNGTVNKKELTAADPLADEYKLIFDYEKHDIKPPLSFAAEELPFSEAFFIVHMSNAIDHSQDPVIAFNKLYRAVQPGGYLILQGFFNEGSHENWKGMHQWNIYVQDNVLIVEDKHGNRRVMDKDPYSVSIYELENKKWYVWIQCRK